MIRVDINAALEQARTLLSRLDLEGVHQTPVHFGGALVGKFVILVVNCGQGAVILLDVVYFRLQQPYDNVALDESIPGITKRGEVES